MDNLQPQLATVVVSIDVPQPQQATSLVTELIELLRRHRTPALWSFEFATDTTVVSQIRQLRMGHEFGLLAGTDWAGPQVGRTEFGHELARRTELARQQEVILTALSLRNMEVSEHFDLLVKHHIPLLRARTDNASGAATELQPRQARFGIWQTEPTIVVPVQSRWSLPWTARRLLQQACESCQTMHIAVAADQLEQHRSPGLATLDYLLKLANARRERGALEILPVGQLLQLYAPRPEQRGARSILRVA